MLTVLKREGRSHIIASGTLINMVEVVTNSRGAVPEIPGDLRIRNVDLFFPVPQGLHVEMDGPQIQPLAALGINDGERIVL